MNQPLLAGALWVLAATVTAFLPMRWQTVPGLALLALAPVLLIWIGTEVGWIWAGLGLLAFLSMFRNPLRYLFSRLTGRPFTLPPEVLARISPEEAARHPEVAKAVAAARAARAQAPEAGAIRKDTPARAAGEGIFRSEVAPGGVAVSAGLSGASLSGASGSGSADLGAGGSQAGASGAARQSAVLSVPGLSAPSLSGPAVSGSAVFDDIPPEPGAPLVSPAPGPQAPGAHTSAGAAS